MKTIGSKEEFLYKMIIDNLTVTVDNNGRIVSDVLLGNLPKDKYTSDEVIEAINLVQDTLYDMYEKNPLVVNSDNFRDNLLQTIIKGRI